MFKLLFNLLIESKLNTYVIYLLEKLYEKYLYEILNRKLKILVVNRIQSVLKFSNFKFQFKII